MQFQFVMMAVKDGKIYLKCFYGSGLDYAEFYISFDLVKSIGEFQPKEGGNAQVLGQAFAEAMASV